MATRCNHIKEKMQQSQKMIPQNFLNKNSYLMKRESSQELHTVLHGLAEPVIHSRPQNATTSGANTSMHMK